MFTLETGIHFVRGRAKNPYLRSAWPLHCSDKLKSSNACFRSPLRRWRLCFPLSVSTLTCDFNRPLFCVKYLPSAVSASAHYRSRFLHKRFCDFSFCWIFHFRFHSCAKWRFFDAIPLHNAVKANPKSFWRLFIYDEVDMFGTHYVLAGDLFPKSVSA